MASLFRVLAILLVKLMAVHHAFCEELPLSSKAAGQSSYAESSDSQRSGSVREQPAAGFDNAREAMCLMIESAAKSQHLPLEFFARVIWQESRFDPKAVGPLTRNGQRALGVAQFMPDTANERGLLDPFDPVQALPKSAEFLGHLRQQFGNLGLAAAAYNAGPGRLQKWISGTGYIPQETRDYVSGVTGASIEDWLRAGNNDNIFERSRTFNCNELMNLVRQSPNPFVVRLEQHVRLGVNLPWGVQLGAGFSRDQALAMYARGISRLANLSDNQQPTLLSSKFRSRGTRTFYQVRIGSETRPLAEALCRQIQKTQQACIVLRNPRVEK